MRTLLAILCPPAAVLLLKPSRTVINLFLTVLLYFPGMVHALSVVSEYETERRNETLMRLISRYER